VKLFRTFLFLTLAAFAPANVFACAACGSANPNAEHSSMADGMNLGILTLLGVLLTVLSVCLFGLVHLIRKSEAFNAAAEQKNSPLAQKV
jgi:threonine/homoserine/homoserine lactone efflux protein